MAQTSLQSDGCTYREKLMRSIGPGVYMLKTPSNDCNPCAQDVPADPYLRYQAWGSTFCSPGSAVDDGSELRGLNYKNSKCSADNYLPGKYAKNGVCTPKGADINPRACAAPTEDTRLSNPPCTLRGTGWNRWEWLCWNPQDRAIVPFEWNTSYRIVAKDNHVPCIPVPTDQTNEIPHMNTIDGEESLNMWAPPANCGASAPGNPFATVQQPCNTLQ